MNTNATDTTQTHTHVTFVLDSSGSMSSIEDDTKGGFNVFLREQAEEPGTATVSLYEFDTTVDRVYVARPIEDAPKLTSETYRPSGQTALFDAIATAVEETTAHIAGLHESDRPDTVVVVVLTDGEENASETPADRVRELVAECREDHGWEFMFIGANQDAVTTAISMGMRSENARNMAHSGEGTRDAYASTSRSISRARRDGQTGGFDDTDDGDGEPGDGRFEGP